jgi:hypothetical protein
MARIRGLIGHHHSFSHILYLLVGLPPSTDVKGTKSVPRDYFSRYVEIVLPEATRASTDVIRPFPLSVNGDLNGLVNAKAVNIQHSNCNA